VQLCRMLLVELNVEAIRPILGHHGHPPAQFYTLCEA
jgi:hypothetical protein